MAKGLGKKIEKIAKLKDCEVVRPWKKSFINHLYWVGMTSNGNGKLTIAKWKSLSGHILNIHSDHEDPLFPECTHPPIVPSPRRKCWLQPGSKAFEKLQDVLLNKRLLNDIERLSPKYQTSEVEGYHSVLIHFCLKSTVFSYKAMFVRLCLAEIHYNSNSGRQRNVKSDGNYHML